MERTLHLVVAATERGGIGKGGGLPWKIRRDMKFFKNTTLRAAPGAMNAVIMGRKTFDSIPARFRPLKSRVSVVVTRDSQFDWCAAACQRLQATS